ncbi:hypothetical protein CDL12_04823 [Handroanthus impetiginosus]|uniref:Uncharacterized protein n=1 Tax=Handroanthus impetiginosus TaxID=429701 RepID=A0A2G9HY71_9LAMI|nr:hypothetical protein CDL12_04823 [Handroanthus impetiginosus]
MHKRRICRDRPPQWLHWHVHINNHHTILRRCFANADVLIRFHGHIRKSNELRIDPYAKINCGYREGFFHGDRCVGGRHVGSLTKTSRSELRIWKRDRVIERQEQQQRISRNFRDLEQRRETFKPSDNQR